jgi:uncharacterized membrane protein
MQKEKCSWKELGAYYVPTIVAVLASPSLPANILAIPKSEIFGFMS